MFTWEGSVGHLTGHTFEFVLSIRTVQRSVTHIGHGDEAHGLGAEEELAGDQ